MEGESNLTTFDVNVYFVVPSKYESDKECDEDMWDAYNKCPDWEINPQWVHEKKCLKMKPDKKDVFVIESFEGEAFERLQNFKCIIIGPRCLLSCFMTGESIPEGSTPVFNTAMRGIVVSASGFSANIKNEIQKKVEYMGGIYTKQLRASVTHLVTDIIMSAKYERAVELGIKIMTINWIHSVWDTNLKDCVLATDSRFNKYSCPVFLNLIATSTNLNKRQKEDIKKIIINNGGELMGVLDGTKVKVVITSETSGLSDKLKYAMQNNIPCLKVEWVYDSIEAGYSLPFNNYLIKSTQACSTPEKSAVQEQLNFSTLSMIPGDNRPYVDETISSSTTMSSTALSSMLSNNDIPAVQKVTYISVMDRLNVADAKKAGPFLDGCNIYLAGFSSNYRDKLNRILNVGSATRLDDISDALTHVIVGDPMKAANDLRIIKSKNLYPYILKVEWLEECMKIQSPAPEENFIFNGKESSKQSAPEPPSPLSKKNLQLLQRPKIPAAPLFDEEDSKSKQPSNDEHSEIVQLYLQKTISEPNNSLREILKLPSNDNLGNDLTITKNQSIAEQWNELTKKNETLNTETRDESAIPVSQESYITQKIFQRLVFVVNGFEDEEYSQIVAHIHELGGKIVGKGYSGIPDFGVVPKMGAELINTVGEIVTDLFIEDCIDNEKLVDVTYYHRPIIFSKNVKPLTNCVIGMSTYNGVERIYLSKLSEVLGARYQDTFARKTNLQKNTYSSTHLVCPMPQGDKYSAAVKWRLPAVTADWLLECATEGKLVDETPFLVGETMAPERPDATITNNDTSLSDGKLMRPPHLTPKDHKILGKQDHSTAAASETPIINKRIHNLISDKTPQSPFHIATPETPYGQMFKDNPSPRTRKAWVKWIDHFPDMPVEEPPPKRRRSTPLSEVKRKAWDFIAGRLDSPHEDHENENIQKNNATVTENEEPVSSHIATNRRLSFSEDSPNKSQKNPAINLQIAQLDELLQKASNTPESRQSLSAEHSNHYHLESNHPVGRCLVKDSQPDSVGWEDPVKRVPPRTRSTITEESESLESEIVDKRRSSEKVQKERKPKFMFSGIKDKGIAEKIIKDLGGEVSSESVFDPTATHLLCFKPSRNEKILSSIAAGLWVLHYLYVEACNEHKKFVNEEEYELGNPKSKGVIPEAKSENEVNIMNAAHRWRIKLLKDPGGAFRNMIALLISPKDKKEQFERLIQAGGGIVVEAKPPYDSSPNGKKITHCFIQLKQLEQQVDWAMMASKGIMCFSPQYLNEHLMSADPLNPRDSVLPEFQKYLALMPK